MFSNPQEVPPSEIWERVREFLRRKGYTEITREDFERIYGIPIQPSRVPLEHDTVATYIHEAVEISEMSRRLGKRLSELTHKEYRNLLEKNPEERVEAHRTAVNFETEYLRGKGIPPIRSLPFGPTGSR